VGKEKKGDEKNKKPEKVHCGSYGKEVERGNGIQI